MSFEGFCENFVPELPEVDFNGLPLQEKIATIASARVVKAICNRTQVTLNEVELLALSIFGFKGVSEATYDPDTDTVSFNDGMVLAVPCRRIRQSEIRNHDLVGDCLER